MMASMSVSKGLACVLAGVERLETSDARGMTLCFSLVGVRVSEANVSCERFSIKWVPVLMGSRRSPGWAVLSWGLNEAIVGEMESGRAAVVAGRSGWIKGKYMADRRFGSPDSAPGVRWDEGVRRPCGI